MKGSEKKPKKVVKRGKHIPAYEAEEMKESIIASKKK